MTLPPDRSPLLTSLLGELAKDRDLEPPVLPDDGIPPRTTDYLLRLIVHPYTTSPTNHPAILKTTPDNVRKTPTRGVPSSNGTFQVYMRSQTTTLSQALEDLKKFVSVYDSERQSDLFVGTARPLIVLMLSTRLHPFCPAQDRLS